MSENSKEMLQKVLKFYRCAQEVIDNGSDDLRKDSDRFDEMVNELEAILETQFELL